MTTRKLIPMLFSTPMALANIQGRKTETRRTLGLHFYNQNPDEWVVGKEYITTKSKQLCFPVFTKKRDVGYGAYSPYGKPGDIIWMRETFMFVSQLAEGENLNTYAYKAGDEDWKEYAKWKPSIHMPLSACRFFAEITEIRLERLMEITEHGAIAEGIQPFTGETEAFPDYTYNVGSYVTARSSYTSLWSSINGMGSWEINPWVWVIKYNRLSPSLYRGLRSKDLNITGFIVSNEEPNQHLLPKDSMDNVLKGEAQP